MDFIELLYFSSFIIFSDDPQSLLVSFCQLFKLPLVVQCCNVICEWPLEGLPQQQLLYIEQQILTMAMTDRPQIVKNTTSSIVLTLISLPSLHLTEVHYCLCCYQIDLLLPFLSASESKGTVHQYTLFIYFQFYILH